MATLKTKVSEIQTIETSTETENKNKYLKLFHCETYSTISIKSFMLKLFHEYFSNENHIFISKKHLFKSLMVMKI